MRKICHKQLLLLVIPVLLCRAAPLFGQERTIGYGFLYGAVGSGGVFYGDTAINDRNDTLRDESFSHIVLALSGGAALILAEPFYLTLGADSVLDFNTSGTKYANYADFSLAAGIRVYPGLGGLFVSVEYCSGSRSSFIRLEKDGDGTVTTPWGNGFRLGAAYDFTHRTNGIAPIIGAAWKHMPRGNNTNDDYLTVYVSMGFRTKK
jgi:hypothetical protein